MHISIEKFLEGEAAAAGLQFPAIRRDDFGRLELYEAANVIGDRCALIETFNDNLDALARLGAVVGDYIAGGVQNAGNRQYGPIRRIGGKDLNGGTA